VIQRTLHCPVTWCLDLIAARHVKLWEGLPVAGRECSLSVADASAGLWLDSVPIVSNCVLGAAMLWGTIHTGSVPRAGTQQTSAYSMDSNVAASEIAVRYAREGLVAGNPSCDRTDQFVHDVPLSAHVHGRNPTSAWSLRGSGAIAIPLLRGSVTMALQLVYVLLLQRLQH
jgi:hypothetical protein